MNNQHKMTETEDLQVLLDTILAGDSVNKTILVSLVSAMDTVSGNRTPEERGSFVMGCYDLMDKESPETLKKALEKLGGFHPNSLGGMAAGGIEAVLDERVAL